MGEKSYFVYILTNSLKTVLYIGVTGNLPLRLQEHKERCGSEFASKYQLTRLVYYEGTIDVLAAIGREKQLKRWSRKKKDRLISMMNPYWFDLSDDFL
jgi:putative endonuclease